MRSTVDIHDSLDRKLRERARELGITYKEALNRVVASGLYALDERPTRAPYRVNARGCGFRAGVDVMHLNRLADEIEDEERWRGGA